jgi:hypothetical protein
MATLIFSAVGTAVGGPAAGALGALVGRQVDAGLFGGAGRQGPRLRELEVTTSTYGQTLPRHYGRMRVPGSIIWATELAESSTVSPTGKGTPPVTSYSYCASFAVAVSSRPILGIGRIWADGTLLRGAAGDLKTAGEMRVHTGRGDQPPDPLIAEAEGEHRCPAWRGTAYVVFESLDLADFNNRLPALTFEVLSDEDFTLRSIADDALTSFEAVAPLDELEGFTADGPLIGSLQALAQIMPLDVVANGDELTICGIEASEDLPVPVGPPVIAVSDADFGGRSGFQRRRAASGGTAASALRYYEVERDYQPGTQWAGTRPANGSSMTVELPAAMKAQDARRTIQRVSRRRDWSGETISWRTSELDPSVVPGATVTFADLAGTWRVRDWEWLEFAVEISAERCPPDDPAASDRPADAGRFNAPKDYPPGESVIVAFEVPAASPEPAARPDVRVAVSSASPGWSGAALYLERRDGTLVPAGASGRRRSAIGICPNVLGEVSPLLLDRRSELIVSLVAEDLALASASLDQLAEGANLALVGDELIQFGRSERLEGASWRLSQLLRGRGGTEPAIGGHQANEPFVLLDSRVSALEGSIISAEPASRIVAIGRGDILPKSSEIRAGGITLRPLSPVHPRVRTIGAQSLELSWVRRARGAWAWSDGVDAPLVEELERYVVTLEAATSPTLVWEVGEPRLSLPSADWAQYRISHASGLLMVRQVGTYGQSEPLLLHRIP